MRNLVSIDDLSKQEILDLIEHAHKLEDEPTTDLLKNTVVAHLFFEPSTRTRLSFETATLRLGGSVIGFSDAGVSSTSKGETLEDTIRVIAQYADAIVIRHPKEGTAERAAKVSTVPIINAGDGANEHPSQTLLDLFSIQKTQGKIDGLHIGLAGDLKYGRTVHSLVKALQHFDVSFSCFAPDELTMPEEYRQYMPAMREFTHLSENIDTLDILYMTRIQVERFPTPADYNKITGSTVLRKEDLSGCKETFKVLHPLPRVDEITLDVDTHQAAYYFQQAKNGVFMRQAILAMLLKETEQ